MKKIKFIVLILLIAGFYFCSENKQERTSEDQALLPKKHPSEWMYNQRAYPDNFINRNAIREAITTSKAILQNRPSQAALDWEPVGPLNIGGRITDVAISPDNDDHLFVSTASGGIFKSTDRGVNWTPIFDEFATLSIGNIAIAPSNAQRIYAGTGTEEANGSYFSDGMYRSDDAGTTWTNIGLPESYHIGRIAVDPTNPDRVFTAVTGKLYGKNTERGIYRTTNAGANWEQVLFVTDSTAAIDVAINPVNTDIVFATMWERIRQPWKIDFAGLTSAVHRSTDGGTTWTELGVANGLPAPNEQTGRIGIAISKSKPSTVYARFTTGKISNVFNGLYRSDDNGDTWTLVTLGALSGIDGNFGWFFGNIRIHPKNPDEVYVLGKNISKTIDNGVSWQGINGMHVDHHALEYSENNTNFMLEGNDGGAYFSENGGSSWTKFTNLPISQFYNIEVDNLQPERLYGGTQDNGTIRTITGGTDDWHEIIGGDGFHVLVDPVDNNYVYGEFQNGNLRRSIDGGFTYTFATNGIDNSDRRNWNTPIVISPFNSEIMYYGSNKLYRSNRAVLWTPISPDLTSGQSSWPLYSATLTAMAASYNNLSTVYTGSDDGNVNVTFDGGTSWTNISADLPNKYVTSLATVPNNDNVAYVTFSGYGFSDYDAHVFKTTDGGQNWQDISSNLPSIPVNDIVVSNANNILFVATDLNVWYSINDGGSWDILGNNLPQTIVMDLKIHEPTNTLYAGTYGRSMLSYDMSNIILSVNSNDLASETIKIYPIPAQNEITIAHELTSEGTITLYDYTGKELKTLFNGNFGASKTISVSTEGFANGIYLLRFSNEGKTFSKKIIISN